MWWEPLLHIICGENMAGWLKRTKNAQWVFECGVQICLESDYGSISDVISMTSSEEGDACMGPGVSDLNKSSSE